MIKQRWTSLRLQLSVTPRIRLA